MPSASRRRKEEVSPRKSEWESEEKTNDARPKPDKTIPVVVALYTAVASDCG